MQELRRGAMRWKRRLTGFALVVFATMMGAGPRLLRGAAAAQGSKVCRLGTAACFWANRLL